MYPRGRDMIRRVAHVLYLCVLSCVVYPNSVGLAHSMVRGLQCIAPLLAGGPVSVSDCWVVCFSHVVAVFGALAALRWQLGVSQCRLYMRVHRAMDLSLLRAKTTADWRQVYWGYGFHNPRDMINSNPHFRATQPGGLPVCGGQGGKWCSECEFHLQYVKMIHTEINQVRAEVSRESGEWCRRWRRVWYQWCTVKSKCRCAPRYTPHSHTHRNMLHHPRFAPPTTKARANDNDDHDKWYRDLCTGRYMVGAEFVCVLISTLQLAQAPHGFPLVRRPARGSGLDTFGGAFSLSLVLYFVVTVVFNAVADCFKSVSRTAKLGGWNVVVPIIKGEMGMMTSAHFGESFARRESTRAGRDGKRYKYVCLRSRVQRGG